MILCLDQTAVSTALGNTVTPAFSTGGSAASDTDFPVTNLWNGTTPGEGFALGNYARFTALAAATDTVIIEYDLTASRQVARCCLSGWFDEDSDSFGLGSVFTNIASIEAQSWNGAAWVSQIILSAANGDFYDILTTPRIWLNFPAAVSATKFRVIVTPIVSPVGTKAIRIGYIGWYDDLATLPMLESDGLDIVDNRLINSTVSGRASIVDREAYRVETLTGVLLGSDVVQLIDQLGRSSRRPTATGVTDRGVVNPRVHPVLALYPVELDNSTTAGTIAANLRGGMVYPLDLVHGGAFGVGYTPDIVYSFREHV